ncbi:MAG: hypothetical protein K1X29_06665 [Bdellovibrionales bacterium]|nr:hypothetical protein [Bdellovibrionales bacterium]
MPRFGFKFWIVTALCIGSAFELVKRVQLSQLNRSRDGEVSELLKKEILPYSIKQRKKILALDQDPPLPHTRLQKGPTPIYGQNGTKLQGDQNLKTSGSFDSNVPQAQTPTDPNHANASDKKQMIAKKCKPKSSSSQNGGLPVVPINNESVHFTLNSEVKKSLDSSYQEEENLKNQNKPNAANPETSVRNDNITPDSRDQENSKNTPSQASNSSTVEEVLEDCPEEPSTQVAAQDEDKLTHKNKNQKNTPNIESKNIDNKNDIVAFISTFGGLMPKDTDPAANKSDEKQLELWKSLLLDSPSLKETLNFIDSYRSGLVSSPVFYQIIQLMLESNVDKIKELGILAAGRTPSPESFATLIEVLKKYGFGNPIRKKAELELNSYEQINNLDILSQVIRSSSDTFAVVWAIQQVEDSAKKYLDAKFNNATTNKNPYNSTYQSFIVLLQEITTRKNQEQASKAEQTLQSLQSLLVQAA